MNKTLARSLMFVALLPIAGCMPKMTIEQMKSMKPERSAELDKLNRFVGHWEGSGTCKMAGLDEELKHSGTMSYEWSGDRWFLIGQHVGTMGELGEMKGFEIISWDAKANAFRSFWVDNMGGSGVGYMKSCKDCDGFMVKAKARTPWGKTTGKGCMKFVDNNNIEWCWKEKGMGGLVTIMEMSGSSKRK